MTLPYDSPAAPTRIHSDYSFAYIAPDVDGTRPAFTEILHTVTDSNVAHSFGDDEWRTFGSGEQSETERSEHEVSLTVLRPHWSEQLKLILGTDDTGWTGLDGENIRLEPETLLWINIQHYKADGTKVGDEYWGEISWNDWQLNHSADGHAQWEFSGIAQQSYELYL